jgi:hypothetical protein
VTSEEAEHAAQLFGSRVPSFDHAEKRVAAARPKTRECRRQCRLFARFSLRFQKLAAIFDWHGRRTPCRSEKADDLACGIEDRSTAIAGARRINRKLDVVSLSAFHRQPVSRRRDLVGDERYEAIRNVGCGTSS